MEPSPLDVSSEAARAAKQLVANVGRAPRDRHVVALLAMTVPVSLRGGAADEAISERPIPVRHAIATHFVLAMTVLLATITPH